MQCSLLQQCQERLPVIVSLFLFCDSALVPPLKTFEVCSAGHIFLGTVSVVCNDGAGEQQQQLLLLLLSTLLLQERLQNNA